MRTVIFINIIIFNNIYCFAGNTAYLGKFLPCFVIYYYYYFLPGVHPVGCHSTAKIDAQPWAQALTDPTF